MIGIVYKKFIADVKSKLFLIGWNYIDLAKATGYKYYTIRAFMCGKRTSEQVKTAIDEALNQAERTDENEKEN